MDPFNVFNECSERGRIKAKRGKKRKLAFRRKSFRDRLRVIRLYLANWLWSAYAPEIPIAVLRALARKTSRPRPFVCALGCEKVFQIRVRSRSEILLYCVSHAGRGPGPL